MRIGFEAKKIFKNYTGLGNYARTLVSNYARSFPGDECVLYSTHNSEVTNFENISNISISISDSISKWYWRSKGIVKQLKQDKIDIFHGTSNELPIGIQHSGIKSVVTIHDLIFKIYPETYNFFDRLVYGRKFKHACKVADKVIATSKQTKKDIIKLYGINESKIEVIYQSCNPVFFKNEGVDFSRLKKYNIPERYNLYVGTVNERKNLKTILKAYKLLPEENKIPLVAVGSGGAYKKQCIRLAKELKIDNLVVWVDNLKDVSDLKCAYQHAQTFIYPSVYEGFGIPVMEAMLSKTPVITSNLSSLPEVTGGNALHINPESEKELADAIIKLQSVDLLRKSVVENAEKYVRDNFNSEKTSKQLHNLYLRLY